MVGDADLPAAAVRLTQSRGQAYVGEYEQRELRLKIGYEF